MIGSMLLMIFMLALSMSRAHATASPSMIAQYDYDINADMAHSNFDLINLLSSKDRTTMKPLAKLMNKLAHPDRSSCDVETEVRFVTVCRSLEESAAEQPQIAQALDSIKSLYAIRKAICETGATDAQLPVPCNKALRTYDHDASQNGMVRSELDLAGSSIIAACLRKFQEHHYFWTSYSNNRQDAEDITHVLRSDVEMHSIIAVYRDFERSMSDLHEDLLRMRHHTTTWFNEASQQAEDLHDWQSRTFRDFDEGFANISLSVIHELNMIDTAIGDHQIALSKLSSTASEGLSDIAAETSVITRGIENMKITIADMYNSAALDLATLTETQADSVDKILSVVLSEHAALSSVTKDLGNELAAISEYAVHIEEFQVRNFEQIQAQYGLNKRILDQQLETADQANEIFHLVQRISLEANDLGVVFNTITRVMALSQKYEHILVAAILYIAICIALAPFEGTVFSSRLVSNIKAGYCAIQAGIYLVYKLNVPTLYNQIKQSMATALRSSRGLQPLLWLVIAIAVVGLTAKIMHFAHTKHNTSKRGDVEQAAYPQTDKACSSPYVCNSQRKRLESIPRNARHGTAPPGF